MELFRFENALGDTVSLVLIRFSLAFSQVCDRLGIESIDHCAGSSSSREHGTSSHNAGECAVLRLEADVFLGLGVEGVQR